MCEVLSHVWKQFIKVGCVDVILFFVVYFLSDFFVILGYVGTVSDYLQLDELLSVEDVELRNRVRGTMEKHVAPVMTEVEIWLLPCFQVRCCAIDTTRITGLCHYKIDFRGPIY